MKEKFSYIGIGLGAIALLLSLIHFWAGPFSPQPTLEDVVAVKAVKIRNATISALKGQQQPAVMQGSRTMDNDQILDLITVILGGLAVILAVLGYARKESTRAASGAAVLGAGAIAFQFAAVALGLIVLAILVSAVLGQIGIG